jgi:hypothetical protein
MRRSLAAWVGLGALLASLAWERPARADDFGLFIHIGSPRIYGGRFYYGPRWFYYRHGFFVGYGDPFHLYTPPSVIHYGPHGGFHYGPYYDPWLGVYRWGLHGGYHWGLHGHWGHFYGL